MPFESCVVVSYAVTLVAGDVETGPVARPALNIHITSPEKASSRSDVYLRFYPAGVTMPPNRRTSNPDGSLLYMVSMRLERYPYAVDLLRNEKPMYFYYDTTSHTAHLSTENEPIGEGSPDADYLRSIGREP